MCDYNSTILGGIIVSELNTETCPDGSVPLSESECSSLGSVNTPHGTKSFGSVGYYRVSASGCSSKTLSTKYWYNHKGRGIGSFREIEFVLCRSGNKIKFLCSAMG